jgi:hypothetical protein
MNFWRGVGVLIGVIMTIFLVIVFTPEKPEKPAAPPPFDANEYAMKECVKAGGVPELSQGWSMTGDDNNKRLYMSHCNMPVVIER